MSMQRINWVYPTGKVMPVEFSLKQDDPTGGLESKDVQKALKSLEGVFHYSKFPEGTTATVFRHNNNGRDTVAGRLTAPKYSHPFMATGNRSGEKGVYSVLKQIGDFTTKYQIPSFAGKAIQKKQAPPQVQRLSFIA